MGLTTWCSRQLERPGFSRRVVVVALLLGAPGLTLGLQGDDHLHRMAILGIPDLPHTRRGPVDLFSFVDGNPEHNRSMMERGELPWWADEQVRASLLRPVTGVTHWLDYQLPPRLAWVMHLHSLAWFAAAVLAAAACYRRILPCAWTAGLAALLYAIDDARGVPVVWLANRNALIGFVFGALCLAAHDRWRREGWRWGAALSPLLLLLGLLGNEGAAAFGGYLLSYAIFIEEGPLRRRLGALLPCFVAGVGWMLAYKSMGYGTYASSVYIDPAAEPLRYLAAAAVRIPLLIWGQFSTPGSDLHLMMRPDVARWFLVVVFAFVVVLVMLMVPLFRRDRAARFFGLGTLLSLVPVAATFPSDRLLTFAGFGGSGLLAIFFASAWRWSGEGATRRRAGRPVRVAAGVLALVHFVVAPLNFLMVAPMFGAIGEVTERVMRSFPSDEAIRGQTVLIVVSPSSFLTAFAPLMHAMEGRPMPPRSLTLCSSLNEVTVRRIDERTLAIRPVGGFLAMPRDVRGAAGSALVNPSFIFVLLDHLFRDDARMPAAGSTIQVGSMTVEVSELTADGRPAEALFRFPTVLEDPSLRWLRWADNTFEPFVPPAAGEARVLAPVGVPLMFNAP